MKRIYVCHTYYHVYVAFLKELNMPVQLRGEATILLSKMSTDFESLKERIEKTGIFESVLEYDEKSESFFPELAKYREDKGNILLNMVSRMVFTKRYAALNAPYVPIDFREYDDIYVFCDADPIGYYLNFNRIRYHAMEDGLNSLAHSDDARYENRGFFQLKVFFSKKLNLLFIQNGYGKYCIDMEVDDISSIKKPCPYYKEVPRKPLVDGLSDSDKDVILSVFVRNKEELDRRMAECLGKESIILILTEPLCTLDIRERIFRDLVSKYEKEGTVLLKPHPRDALDYEPIFPECIVFDPTVPMEMLNFIPGFRVKKVVSVLTEIKAIEFADEVVRLGPDFMDLYEAPEIHRQNEQI